MLPPIDPGTLERNPRFKALYEALASEKLNPDASTRDPGVEGRDGVRREAIAARKTAQAKTRILLQALEAARVRAGELPDELHEVLVAVSALANGRVNEPDEREVLREDVAYFTHIQPIAAALSAQLLALATLLQQVAVPDAPPSNDLIPALPTLAKTHQKALDTSIHTLATQRTHLATLSAAALAAQARAAEAAIRVLEQTAHGSISRGLRAKAECLATVARGVELKIGILAATTPPSPPTPSTKDLNDALRAYGEHVAGATAELLQQRDMALERLREFEEAGGGNGGAPGGAGLMRDIASRYAEIEEEIARVRGELGRLDES